MVRCYLAWWGLGATQVSIEEELARIVPVIAGLRSRRPDGLISVDTYKAEVARAAVAAGANMVTHDKVNIFSLRMVRLR